MTYRFLSKLHDKGNVLTGALTFDVVAGVLGDGDLEVGHCFLQLEDFRP